MLSLNAELIMDNLSNSSGANHPDTRPLIKTALRRLFGCLPRAVLPFDELQRHLDSDHVSGVHRIERPIGVLREFQGSPTKLAGPVNILGAASPELINGEPRHFKSTIFPRMNRRAYIVSDGGVLGHMGVIYHRRSRTAVQETIREWIGGAARYLELQPLRRPPPISLSGLTVVLAAKDSQGFYHFLLDLVARIPILKPELLVADHILISGPSEDWRVDWLRLSGVDVEKIIWLDNESHFVCDQVVFSDYPARDLAPDQWVHDALCELMQTPRGDRSGKIWVSRRLASKRHIVWEQEIASRIPDLQIVHLESMSAYDQVSLFAAAELVAGPHGAGLTNIVFCPPGFRFVELFPHDWFPTFNFRPLFARHADIAKASAVSSVIVDFDSRPTARMIDLICEQLT